MELKNKKCRPCEGGVQPLTLERIGELLDDVDDWSLENERLAKDFKFKNFRDAVAFVNKVAELADEEGHHPDILVHDWNIVKIILYTHAINGLSENDFIIAAKIDDME